MQQIISKFSAEKESSGPVTPTESPPQEEEVDLDHLRQSFDRLTVRRVTDFSQVYGISDIGI